MTDTKAQACADAFKPLATMPSLACVTPWQDAIDLADYIGCLEMGVRPDPLLRDRVAVILARVSAWKAVNK